MIRVSEPFLRQARDMRSKKACRINSRGRLPKLYVEGSIPFARSNLAR